MANITAADVKALRDRTGAGMMDSKKALEEADGDVDKAIEFLRVKGKPRPQKRDAGRTASAGLVAAHVEDGVGTLVEINCETDFVAKSEPFVKLADRVLDQAVKIRRHGRRDAARQRDRAGQDGRATCSPRRTPTIGEKIEIRRVARLEAPHIASYLHRTAPTCRRRSGCCWRRTPTATSPRTSRCTSRPCSPAYLTRDDVPADVVASERRIAEETAREEGKPEQALPRIVEGRVNGFFKDNVLLEQPFAKDNKKTVQQVLKEAGVNATGFARFKVGA